MQAKHSQTYIFNFKKLNQVVVVRTFVPKELGGRDRQICEFQVSLVYWENSRTASKAGETLSHKTKNK